MSDTPGADAPHEPRETLRSRLEAWLQEANGFLDKNRRGSAGAYFEGKISAFMQTLDLLDTATQEPPSLPAPKYEQDEVTGLTRMTNFADVLKASAQATPSPINRSTPCPFCSQETAHSHRIAFSGRRLQEPE